MGEEQLSVRAVAPKETRVIQVDQIIVGHRYRQDQGDIESLAQSIKQNGLIHPIVVKEAHGDEGKYYLMAGGRRIKACKALGWTEITCNVYPQDLSQLERNVIELCENIDRKDMEYAEQVALTDQIHLAMQKLYGVKKGGHGGKGHSMSDTARMLGVTKATASRDITLAKAIEKVPELAQCKDKKEAMKLLQKMVKQKDEEIIVKRIEEERGATGEDKIRKRIIDSYIVGDFFKLVSKVREGTVHLCEVDPPFGINLQRIKKKASVETKDYNEWDQSDYADKIFKVMQECYRVMAKDSWIIWWFAYEPWFEITYTCLERAGFSGNRVPAIWVKKGGQASNPGLYMASSHEPFFYMRKGRPELWRQGRANHFSFKTVAPDSKIHPTEKPVELMDEIYRTFVPADSRILIPFAGSGNGILAAYNQHCQGFGYDLTKEYKTSFTIRANANVPPNYKSYR